MATNASVPPFEMVIFPRRLLIDGESGGTKFSYALETAAAVYRRPEVQKAVAQAIQRGKQDWQKPTVNALTWKIFEVLTEALVSDLKQNGAKYAEHPEDAHNPVPGLQKGDTAKNRAVIDKLISGAKAELQENLVVEENLKEPKP